MRFDATPIEGVVRIDAEPALDDRGWFARLHCESDFAAQGLPARMVQTSLSHSTARGTVRGMHFQRPPSREGKLVRCVRGAIYDVVIDLRAGSSSYLQHVSAELTAANRSALFIGPGLAHGFQTLEPDTEVLYQMTDFHDPSLASGVRWNDPAFGIEWPLPAVMIHTRDAAYPDFDATMFSVHMTTREHNG